MPKIKGISLQLEDHMSRFPRGIMEVVLVKVDRFVFHVDYLIINMEDDTKMLILVGRPFPRTGYTLIDVYDDTLTMRFFNE